MPIDDFPETLLGEIASGFENTYYLQHRNYLVFANNLLQLKNFTLSIENEDTWGKSFKVKKLLDQANKSANLSLFINTPRSWERTISQLKPNWKNLAKTFQFQLRNLEFISLQFSAVDNKYYTNFTIHQPYAPSGTIPEKINTLESITLADDIITKPYLITNHNTREREIMVQDSSYQLYQLGQDFNQIWNQPIGERIVSDITQIDFYKNGKLQVAFATKSGIHIIDRTGNYIPGFPKELPGKHEIAHFSIIDYDNSKNYRFGIADTKGNVYLTDKEVKPLKPWNPLKFDSPLINAPQHFRVGRRDVILAVQQNGKVNLLSRRGEEMERFPINLDTDITSEVYVKETNDLTSTSLHLVTKTGELMELSFAGHLINREQLYKPAADSRFKIIRDVAKEAFIIRRITDQKHEILDEKGQLLGA